MGHRLEQVFRDQYGKMLHFIIRRIDDAAEAEDMLQEIFVRATEHVNVLDPIDNLVAWLWCSVKNRVIDYYRARAFRRERETELIVDDGTDGLDLLADLKLPGGEHAYLRRIIADTLYESLDELPESQREVFILQAIEGRTFAEIAELTGESINTLTARKRYAVKFLRQRLKEIKELLHEEM